MRSYLASLNLGLLLIVALCANPFAGCNPTPVDPTTPPVVQTAIVDGLRLTTVTLPDEMSTLTYSDIPLPSGDCRIKRMVYKTYQHLNKTEKYGKIEGRELIRFLKRDSINPARYIEIKLAFNPTPMVVDWVCEFLYDPKGRLTQELTKYWQNYNDTLTYTYEPSRIVYRSSVWQGGRYVHQYTLPLNEKGFARINPEYYSYGQYDEAGFLVLGNASLVEPQQRQIKQWIENGNIVKRTDYLRGSFGTGIWTYPTYVARPNLPNPRPFWGRQSQQLVAEEYVANEGNIYDRSDGLKARIRHIYQFDSQGRVVRRIKYSIPLSTDNCNGACYYETGGVSITDYEYECP